MSDSESESGLVLELAEEFLARHRAGKRPSVGEYLERHPELADEIREVFPAMAMMENIAIEDESLAQDVSPSEASAAKPVLAQLGDFRIVRELGRGGMGIVYEAEQVSLGRHVALKVLPQSHVLDASQRRRFDHEARAAARLHHTNIVPVFGIGEAEGVHYYVMQFIQGLGLDQVIAELKHMKEAEPSRSATPPTGELRVSRRHDVRADQVARSLMTGEFDRTSPGDDSSSAAFSSGFFEAVDPAGLQEQRVASTPVSPSGSGRLSDLFAVSPSSGSLPGQKTATESSGARRPTYWHSVAHIGVQVGEALQHAHEQGILHRDIKPSNLLLDLRGTVWVTDFGLAKATDQQDITHTGDILGTLRYMPPEAFEGQRDARSDVYSLGLTLYELLSFRPAFLETDRHTLIKQISTETPPRLHKLNPEIPRDLVTIVHKSIERDAGDRYQSAGELSADLQRFNNDEPIKARRLAPLERYLRWSRRNKLVASLGAALTAVLVIAVVASSIAAVRFRKLAADREQERLSAIAQERLATLRSELEQRSAYVAQINLAERAAQDFDAEHAIDTLLGEWAYRKGRPDIRGWEWFYLAAGRDDSRWTVPLVGNEGIGLWNPKRALLAAAIPGGIQLFDADTGKQIRTLLGRRVRGPSGYIECAAWSPEGRRIAAGCHDGTVRVWDADTGLELFALDASGWPVGELRWSPDGRWIAALKNRRIHAWDGSTGQERLMSAPEMTVRAMSWRDANRLTGVVGTGDRVATANVETGEIVELVLPEHLLGGFFTAIAWNPDGSRLAIGYGEGGLGIWEAAQPETSRYIPSSEITGSVQELSWSPAGAHVAAVVNGVVHLVEVDPSASRKAKVRKLSHRRAARTISWSSDGKRLLAASGVDRTLRVLAPFDDDATNVLLRAGRSLVGAIAWSPDGKLLAGHIRGDGDSEYDLQIWDRRSGERLGEIPGPHRSNALAWAPEGGRLATIQGNVIRVWDSSGGELRRELPTTLDRTECIAWSADGTRIAAGGGQGRIEIREVVSRELEQSLDGHERSWGSNRVRAVAWSSDDRWLASVAHSGSLMIWDVKAAIATDSLQIGTRYGVTSPIRVVHWSPDGKRLAASSLTATADRNIWIWNVVDGKAGAPLVLSGPDGVYDLTWSPDGRRLASAYENHVIKLWDVEIIPGASTEDSRSRSRDLLTLRGHSAAVRSLSWNPLEPVLVSSSLDGTVRLWDASRGYELDRSPKSLAQSHRQLEGAEQTAARLRWLAETHALLGEWDEAAADFEAAANLEPGTAGAAGWFLTPWWIAGYFGQDLRVPAHPERQTDPWLPLVGDDGTEKRWRPTFGSVGGVVDFDGLLGSREQISAYALTRVYSLREQEIPLLLGSDESVRVWVNGSLVHELLETRGTIMDEDVVPVRLRKGWNTVLARVANELGGHSLVLRLSSEPSARARVHEDAGRWEEAITKWTEAIEADPENMELHVRRGLAALKAERIDQARLDFAKAIARHPESDSLRIRVALGYAVLGEEMPEEMLAGVTDRQGLLASRLEVAQSKGRWREAAAILKFFVATDPQPTFEWHNHAYRLAFMLAHLRDEEGYRRLCRRTLEAFRETGSVQIAERTTTMCLFAGILGDPELVQEAARLADFAVENVEAAVARAEVQPWMVFFTQHAQGIAQYRLGRYEAAIDSFERSVEGMNTMARQPWVLWCQAADLFFSAMAHHRLGQTTESHEKLQQAENRLSLTTGAALNTDWLLVEMVRSEAGKLLLGESAAQTP